jgi:hypothetical protein
LKKKATTYFETSASIHHSTWRKVPEVWNLFLGLFKRLIQGYRADVKLGRCGKSAYEQKLKKNLTTDGCL